MPAHIGLYFPYFHFPNDNWVKVSALYWDKLYRIVPYGYQTKRDSDLVKILSDSNNEISLIRNIHPEDYYDALNQIKISFIRLIENHTKEIVYHYGIDKRHEWSGVHAKVVRRQEAKVNERRRVFANCHSSKRNVLWRSK